ncbi:MAG: GNAT family N-acetyltransferase [Erysipelotrichaceae bacterium]|nr:GNAT family N-acetyltransferase [Erysipelotrichaceae bacterium]
METDRLIIDKVVENDHEDYFNNISHDTKVLETFICRYAENLEEFDINPYVNRDDILAVRLKENGRLIGILCCFDVKENESCEIGYGIGSAYWNQGYTTEAVKRYIKYLFEEKNLKTVYASHFPENTASRRVMEKCGMKYSHRRDKELTYLNKERDLIYYSISRQV